MKVGILSASVSHRAGGIYECVRRSAQELQNRFLPSVRVYGLTDDYFENDREAWGSLGVSVFQARGFKPFGYSPDLLSALLSADVDLLHCHGLWMYPSVASLRWARITGKPHIISVHGMLDPWALKHSSWKKSAAGMLYERRHLKGASCLHAVSGSEVNSIRRYGLANPVCLIPYGVDVPCLGTRTMDRDEKVLLFLGRIHPKKGLVNLLNAWHHVQGTQSPSKARWKLIIAGWDQANHQSELLKVAKELGVVSSVNFVGPKFGSDKDALLRSAHAFVLPSFSEGLPVSILEAWSYGLPVLMTPECNIPEGFQMGAAISIGTEIERIASGLNELKAMGEDELVSMGIRGRQLVQKRFSWVAYTSQLYAVYIWLLGDGHRPDFVIEA